MAILTQSRGLLSYFQLPETFDFVSLQSADTLIDLLLFVHNEMVTIPNTKRKIVADIQTVNHGEYYMIHLHWQAKNGTQQRFATASAFIRNFPDQKGCEVVGFAELTLAMTLFGLLLLMIAFGVYFMTAIGWIVFLLAAVAYVLAMRGAIQWRNALISHLMNTAQILPHDRRQTDVAQEEYDQRIDKLVKGIKQGV